MESQQYIQSEMMSLTLYFNSMTIKQNQKQANNSINQSTKLDQIKQLLSQLIQIQIINISQFDQCDQSYEQQLKQLSLLNQLDAYFKREECNSHSSFMQIQIITSFICNVNCQSQQNYKLQKINHIAESIDILQIQSILLQMLMDASITQQQESLSSELIDFHKNSSQQSNKQLDFSPIGIIMAVWIGKGNASTYYSTSTAFLISPTQLVTCSHAIEDKQGRQCSYFTFIPFNQQETNKVQKIKLQKFNKRDVSSTKYNKHIDQDSIGRQFMLINLHSPIESVHSYLKLIDSQSLVSKNIKIIGYPQPKIKYDEGKSEVQIINAPRQEYTSSNFQINQKQLKIIHDLPTQSGMSGSPLFGQYEENGKIRWGVFGINVRKSLKLYASNIGFLISNQALKEYLPVEIQKHEQSSDSDQQQFSNQTYSSIQLNNIFF